MRIAVVTADWPCTTGGGVAALMSTLAGGLHASGHGVEVWTRGGGGRTRTLNADVRPYPVVALSGRSWRRRGARHWRSGLPEQLDRFRPDGVVVATWDPLPGAAEPLERAGLVPRVFAHGRDITGDPGVDRLEPRATALSSAARWFCLTRWMERELTERGVPGDRVVRVPAAVPPAGVGSRADVASDRTSSPHRILALGRLVPRKGQDVLLDALRRLPLARLDVVGEGPDRARLEGLIARFDLADRATIHGHLPRAALEALWAQAAVFALPVRDEAEGDVEGFGLVYLEAAARGVAALGSRRSGAAEAIVAGETGLLLDQPEDPAAVADALATLLEDEGHRSALGRAARARWSAGHQPEDLAAAVVADFEGRA